jgi:hypothetical protein
MRVRDTFARMRACRCGVLSLVGSLLLTATAGAQAKPPSLSKAEREGLRAAVLATRTLATVPQAAPTDVSADLFRASDGSHYVALSLPAPAELPPAVPVVLYVKLVPRAVPDASGVPPTVPTEPRSAVLEWLEGQRSDPLPMRARRVVTVPSGELPVGGPTSMSGRDGGIGQSTAALRLMDRQQEQQRERAEALERERQRTLEGKTAPPSALLPFEDFDARSRPVRRPGRQARWERAVTAPPGEYDVVLGWATLDSRGRPATVGTTRHHLSLPAAPRESLRLGSVVVADAIGTVAQPYPADQQSAHPYVLGTTDITPAADRRFTNDERLAVAFQIINPAGDATGKPDVRVGFRLYRRVGIDESLVGTPSPLTYTADTLPVDFNVGLGHPLLAALALPLTTLPRGQYRLAISATDMVARTAASGEALFDIIPTRAALLADIPGLQPPLRRARAVSEDVLTAALAPLRPVASSSGVREVLQAVEQRRFAEAVREVPLPEAERGLGELFRAVAFYGLGDTPTSLAARLARAEALGAPVAAVRYWQGWVLALQSRDTDAVTAWREAERLGWPQVLTAPLEVDALLRLRQSADAGAAAARAIASGLENETLRHAVALAALEAGQPQQTLEVLAPVLATTDDADTLWLAVRAHAEAGLSRTTPLSTDERTAFTALVDRYRRSDGRHRDRADEWLAFLTASSSGA